MGSMRVSMRVRGVLGVLVGHMGERVVEVLEGVVVVVDKDQREILLMNKLLMEQAYKGQDPMGEGQDPVEEGLNPVGGGLDQLEELTVDQILRELVEDQIVGEEDLPEHQEEDLAGEGKSLVLFLSCQS